MKILPDPIVRCGHRGFSATIKAADPRASEMQTTPTQGCLLVSSLLSNFGYAVRVLAENQRQDPLSVLPCGALGRITCSQIP